MQKYISGGVSIIGIPQSDFLNWYGLFRAEGFSLDDSYNLIKNIGVQREERRQSRFKLKLPEWDEVGLINSLAGNLSQREIEVVLASARAPDKEKAVVQNFIEKSLS